MIRTFVQKDLQYVIEAHIRIYRNEYNYDYSFAEFITNAVNSFGLKGNHAREMLWLVELDQAAFVRSGAYRRTMGTCSVVGRGLEYESQICCVNSLLKGVVQ